MKIVEKLTDLIGNTPMVEMKKYSEKMGVKAKMIAKLEYFNPAGSVKDRVAMEMIEEAERTGVLKKGATIIEPTSGNTGIGLAMVAKVKGYRLILTMPETMSEERKKLLRARGAELVLTPGNKGMNGAVEEAEKLKNKIEGGVILQQFDNPANPAAHRRTTGREIWRDTEGKVECFVAGVGTGGTISGVGEALKEKNSHVKVVAVEPDDSPILSGGEPGPHKLQGIGANFIPENYNGKVVDEVIRITTEQAYQATRDLAEMEGMLVGISAGAAVAAATIVGKREEMRGKMIVVLLPDGGEKYLSTELFE